MFDNSDSRLVITEPAFADIVAAASGAGDRLELGRYCVGGGDGFIDLAELTNGRAADPIEGVPLGDVMVYTSGTTGRPKGVRRELGKGDVLATLDLFADIVVGGRGQGERPHLVSCPLYHRGPFITAAVAMHVGHPLVLMDKWSPEEWVRLAAEHHVTSAYVVPTMIHRLVQLPAEVRDAADLSSLDYVLHSAAPCSPVDKRRFIEWLGPIVYESYGGTEGGGRGLPAGVVGAAGHGREALARCRDPCARRGRQRMRPRRRRHRLHPADLADVRLPQGSGQDRGRRPGRCTRSATSAGSTRRDTCSCSGAGRT